ncbi:MAG: hypothetical protein KGR68_09205 [Betaproteobacteria bacterium]|nr:hypothetical protein [Betaproteobacteria bacterium]
MAFLTIYPRVVRGDAPDESEVLAFAADLLALCEKHGLFFVACGPLVVSREYAIADVVGMDRVIEVIPAGSIANG